MSEVPGSPSPATPGSSEAAGAPAARWPRVIGTIGIVVGALMALDKLDDLLMLPLLRSRDWWAGLVGEEIGELVVRWMPATSWIVVTSLVGLALGVLLIVGALRLRRGRLSGVELCRTWSWLALGWLVVEMGAALRWMWSHAAELGEFAPGAYWQGPAVFGILLALLLLAAFPAFLLGWFSRPGIKAQLAGWPR